jgi:hypothetical protein
MEKWRFFVLILGKDLKWDQMDEARSGREKNEERRRECASEFVMCLCGFKPLTDSLVSYEKKCGLRAMRVPVREGLRRESWSRRGLFVVVVMFGRCYSSFLFSASTSV